MVRSLTALVVLLTASACGGSTDTDAGGTGGQAGGGAAGGGGAGGSAGGTGGGGGSGGFCESIVPCCDAQGNPVSPVCPTPGNPECPPGTSWPPTGTCEPPNGTCTPSKPCAADEWCDYPDNLCGSGLPGKCVKRPQGCNLLYAPVCTCAGQQASNECAAASGGSDVSAKGGCTPPEGMFACGEVFCFTGKQYCQVMVSDIAGWPDGHTCKDLPSACGTAPICGCVASEPCGSWCKADASGNLVLTCPGG